MKHPLLYEINTRCWLRELSTQTGRPVDLASVPEPELDRWQELGFTLIWLMGVWTTGPRARQESLDSLELRKLHDDFFPGAPTTDLLASPFAIADYTVPRSLGGEAGLKKFRARLHQRGIKLILDFVPNHVGLDHPWLAEHPEFFVQSAEEIPEAYPQETPVGPRWIAHGKDPNFYAWTDTAQLDYRRAEVRAAMQGVLANIARRCDGVRCDMAMLLLGEIFVHNWRKVPVVATASPAEFWEDAITEIRVEQPGFLFLGEVYWDLEARMQSLGFDYTYDKQLYDFVIYRHIAEVRPYLLRRSPQYLAASAHFLENHDEERVAAKLTVLEHRAAALLMFGLPGLRLLHEGQLTGARNKVPVQFGRRPAEAPAPEIEALYEYLLAALTVSLVGKGEFSVIDPAPAWPDNVTHENFVLVQWRGGAGEFDLVVVNLSPHPSQCHVPLVGDTVRDYNWEMKDLLGEEQYLRRGDEIGTRGLYLDLPGHGAQLFHFRPLTYSESFLEARAAKF